MLNQKLMGAAAGAAADDPNFKNVTLLLNGDGTNGAQNNTFLDSSTNNFTITRNGNTTQGTFSPYGNLWSNYFDGSGDYLTLTGSALGSGNFTIEFWINPFQLLANGSILDIATSGTDGFLIRQNTNGILVYDRTTSTVLVSTSSGFSVGTWAHVAVVRNSNTVTLYVNGTSAGSASDSTNFTQTAYYICAFFNSAASPNQFNGYLSNLRVTNTAVYTSNFTPSTTPLTAISGTSLLTCQSNRFIDNSSNNFAITVNGNTSVQRFSPFNPTAAYSTSTIGGSGYFDGSGDYLTVASNPAFGLGTSDFTISYWYYPIVAATDTTLQVHFGNASTSNEFACGVGGSTIGALYFTTYTIGYSTTAVAKAGAWNHIVWSRVSGTLYAFLNGVQVLSTSFTTNLTASALGIGSSPSLGYTTKACYISDMNLVKGIGTTSVTVPTAPQTATTGTSLLCNFTNAGIPDAAMMNNLETVGNAQVSTSVKKYGTGSLYFDGTVDGLKSVGTNVSLQLGSGNFTIDGWVYFNSVSGNAQIINTATGATNNSYAIYRLGTTLQFYLSSTGTTWDIASGSTIGTVGTNTWYHFALVRNGSTFTPYFNGVAGTTVTSSASLFANSGVGVGNDASCTSADVLNGYIDDLRVTKGLARYTANFTPPTAALPTY